MTILGKIDRFKYLDAICTFYFLGGSIYAFLENSDIANVDVLDTLTNTWNSAEPLPQSRSSSGCAVYELNGNI